MSPIRPTPPRPTYRFTRDSGLRGMVVGMISTNSLAAFTAEVSRSAGISPVRGPSIVPEAGRAVAATPDRKLDTLPPTPSGPLPRGSLLDLRV